MNAGTVTRADLAEALYREIGLSRSESAVLVESVIDNIIESLLKGENVKLAGFGTFSSRADFLSARPCIQGLSSLARTH